MVAVTVAASMVPVAMAMARTRMAIAITAIAAADDDGAPIRGAVVRIRRVVGAVRVRVHRRRVGRRVIHRVRIPRRVRVPLGVWIRRPADDDRAGSIRCRDADPNAHVMIAVSMPPNGSSLLKPSRLGWSQL